jgi:hypothetical protein
MRNRLLTFVFLFLLAPLGAVVCMSALLLFGVKPATVFAPGFAVKNALVSLGFHAPNAVGVASTAVLWWIVIAAIGMVWDRRKRKPVN